MRIDLADGRLLDPRQRGDALARGLYVEADQRRPAVQPEPAQHVDLGGLAIAGHLDLVDGKAGACGDPLHETVEMAAEIAAIRGARRQQDGRQDGGGKRRRGKIVLAEARDEPDGPAQPARQHETRERWDHAGGRAAARGPPAFLSPSQRRHEASSTIQLNRSPNECPAWAAISGTRDVGVMPGWVLISSQTTSPFSEWRSS